ncbi:hypothetical protein StrepF001_29585 [Streptomyces sp. F001]|nr:hypothetical protein StrepF001_29585 [Streptomyces sp. F001]
MRPFLTRQAVFSGSVRLRGAKACVETATVLSPSGLRAFAVSTQARPFGSLAGGWPPLAASTSVGPGTDGELVR